MKHVDIILLYTVNNRSTVDDLWEMAANKIAPVLITCTQSVRRNVYGLNEILHVHDSLYTVSQGIKRNL